MLIPLDRLVRDHGVVPCPVLHVGAHLGEEAPAYRRHRFAPVYWVEGNEDIIPQLAQRVRPYGNHHVVRAIVADRPRDVTFHLASNGQSSSILPFGTHATEHPEVTYVGERSARATTVDQLARAGLVRQARLMNIDVQGAELDVLKGAELFLEQVDYVYTELNDAELYEGCALTSDLVEWLEPRGFRLVAKVMTSHGWGDGLFVRGAVR